MENSRDKKSGFTLSEVLITLVIIGIIAALTIPSLIQKLDEQHRIAALKKNYAIASAAMKMVVALNGELDSLGIPQSHKSVYTPILAQLLKPHLSIMKDCSNEPRLTEGNSCTAKKYYNSNGYLNMYFFRENYNVDFILSNGATHSILFTDVKCKSPTFCGEYHIDLTGPGGDNKLGKDYFVFYFKKDGTIVPAGLPNSGYVQCNTYNGHYCTAWAIYKGNMDYVRKTVSW